MCSLSVFLQEKLFPHPSILHWYFMLLSVRAASAMVFALALLPVRPFAEVGVGYEFSSVNVYKRACATISYVYYY
jgi:hypothetical protein